MKRVNNRYQILDNVSLSRDMVSYRAVDLWTENKTLEITLFAEDAVPRRLMQSFREDCLKMTTLSGKYIRHVNGFSRLTSVDGMKRRGKVFFYTEDSLEGCETLMAHQKGKTFWEKTKLFFEILEDIYYLHLSGYVYGYVKPDNIYVGAGRAKLKSLVDITVKSRGARLENILVKKNDLADAALLFRDMLCDGRETEVFGADWISETYGLDRAVSGTLVDILRQAALRTGDAGYGSVLEFSDALQNALGTVYSIVDIRELEKLNFSTSLVGRREALQTVLTEYSKMRSFESSKKIFLVNGNTGTGKTRFLEELYFVLSLEEDCVYESSITDKSDVGNYDMWQRLLRSITKGRNKDVARKYMTFVTNADVKITEEGLPESQDVLRTILDYTAIDRISTFIRDGNMGNPVFIVDNFDNADTMTLDAVSLFCRKMHTEGNAILILSCNDYHLLEGDVLAFLEKIGRSPLCEKIELSPFTLEEAGEYVKNTLVMPEVPQVMTKRIYDGGYRTPLFIGEILRKLQSTGSIFRSPRHGQWMIELCDMPKTAEEFYQSRPAGRRVSA